MFETTNQYIYIYVVDISWYFYNQMNEHKPCNKHLPRGHHLVEWGSLKTPMTYGATTYVQKAQHNYGKSYFFHGKIHYFYGHVQ